ncbi:hypothetical protein ACOSP7_021899 [Xanthoceras sorbifolium]
MATTTSSLDNPRLHRHPHFTRLPLHLQGPLQSPHCAFAQRLQPLHSPGIRPLGAVRLGPARLPRDHARPGGSEIRHRQ